MINNKINYKKAEFVQDEIFSNFQSFFKDIE